VKAIGPGTTNITFTINGGCNGTPSAHQSVTVNPSTNISSNPSGYPICVGGTATALSVTASGTGPLHYTWYKNTTNSTTGGTQVGADASTYTPDVSSPGTLYYYVIVNSDCGPATSTVAAITVSSNPTISLIQETDVKCFNDVNGTVTISVSNGTPGYKYMLSSTTTSFTASNTTGSFTGLAADTYNVIVTDAAGCSSATGMTTVGAPAKLTAGFTTTDVTCFNMNNGTATITPSGGTGLYHYSIDGNLPPVGGDNLISKTFIGLVPGPHAVVVTDDNGCSTTVTFTINQPTQLTAVASAGTLNCNNSTTPLFVIANGGTPPYMYSLNGGTPQSSFVFTVGAGPSYIVTVTDAHCSVNTAAVSVANPTQMSIAFSNVIPAGCGSPTGSFTVTASGGTGSYTYSDNGGNSFQSSGTFTSLAATSYVVTAKDGNGCTISGIVTISQANPPNVYTVSGGGSTCTNQAFAINLSNAQSGITYYLQIDGVTQPNPVINALPGSPFSFGNFTTAGKYTVVALDPSSGCQIPMSGSATISSGMQPTAFAVTGGGGYCSGPGIPIGLFNSETGVNYVLMFNNTTNVGFATGTTGHSLSFGNYTAIGSYSVVATNTSTNCTNTMSNPVSISAGTPPTAFNVAGTGGYCNNALGVDVTLSSSENNINISYQLLRNGSNIDAAQTGNGGALDFGYQTAGTYTVLATNTITGCTKTMNGSAIITLNSAAPTILTQPAVTQTVCAGSGVSFSVVASADATGYQWLKNSAIIPGANGATYTIPSTSPSDAGSYSAIVLGTCGNTNSDPSALIVNSAVTINTPPQSQSICGSVVLSVNASNATGYQWYLGASSIIGAVGSQYTATAPGSYTVVVSGPCGAPQTSLPAVLIATPGVNITTQPLSQPFTGSNLLSVVASNATGYQWFLGGISITGANSSTYTATVAGTYTVLVTGCNSQQLSNQAVLSTCAPVAINTQPVGGSFCGSMQLSVGASNATGYQWYLGINSISGANSATYTATAPGSYTVIVSGPCGAPQTSNAAVLTAAPGVTINTQPVGGSFCGSIQLSVNASNASGYQWTLGGSNITGANSPTYTATAAGTYRVIVSAICGSPVTSNAAVLTANGGVNITTQPVNKTICSGGSATFSVTASGATGYQWYRGNNSIGGATNSTYTTGVTGSYHVVVNGGCGGPVTSNTVTLSITPGVTIVTQPVSTQMCAGGSESFSVVANNATGYQWYRNSNLIIGATNAQYTTNTTGTYDVRVFDGCGGSVMSNFATLTINPPVAITSQPQSQMICSGSTATFTVGTTNANGYQWYRNNNPIAGGTNSSYTTGVAGNYKVVVTGGCGGPVTSNVVTLSFLPPPSVAAISGTNSICAGTTVRFTDPTSGGTWSSSNTSIATVTATGFVRGVGEGTATINYMISNGCTSNTATRSITVSTTPDVDAITGSSSVCAGSTTQLSDATANGNWSSSNTTIATVSNNGRVRGIKNGNVTISYTVQNGCGSSTVDFPFAVGCSGILKNSLTTTNDVITLDVSVSPNPTQNYFTLIAQSSVLDVPLTISIFDMQNRLVDKHTAGVGEAVRFGDRFAAGMYIVQVQQGALIKTVKVVKN
jgi:hypothetical protein